MLPRLVRSTRPYAYAAAGTISIVGTYVAYRETTATTTLPRQYDWDAVNAYWSDRPLSTTYRLGSILYHLGPTATSYIWRTYVRGAPEEEKAATTEWHRTQAVAVRKALTALGPAFVKMGQQLSIRPDLLPAVVLRELQMLCDAVEPMPDPVAYSLLCEELEIDSLLEIFQAVPHRVAAASLGQVYKGVLKESQQTVAIKVQRPHMLESFSRDLFLLQRFAVLVDSFTSSFTEQPPFHKPLYESFAAGCYSEMDYEQEAVNQTKFREELSHLPVIIPKVISATRTVLVSEWVNGSKLADASPERIRELIPIGVELFLTQLLDTGHFHGDPHVGNLLVEEESGQLCLLDFGLCCRISQAERESMTTAMYHLLTRNFDALVEVDAKDLGFLPPDLDVSELKPLLVSIITAGINTSDIRKRQRQFMEISGDLNQVFFQYPFSVPPFFALVTRGLGLLEGIAISADPEFDIFRVSAPYARRRALQLLARRSIRRPATTNR